MKDHIFISPQCPLHHCQPLKHFGFLKVHESLGSSVYSYRSVILRRSEGLKMRFLKCLVSLVSSRLLVSRVLSCLVSSRLLSLLASSNLILPRLLSRLVSSCLPSYLVVSYLVVSELV